VEVVPRLEGSLWREPYGRDVGSNVLCHHCCCAEPAVFEHWVLIGGGGGGGVVEEGEAFESRLRSRLSRGTNFECSATCGRLRATMDDSNRVQD
jgi:hypothetical protein